MKNYRFKEVKLRAYNKTAKKMFYSNQDGVAFINSKTGFSVVEIDLQNFNVEGVLADDEDSVLMNAVHFKDKHNNDIYEGDVVFFRRHIAKQLLPMVGVVMGKDFSYSINSGIEHFPMVYNDKDLEILGNIFENTDEELAKKAEEKISKYRTK